MSGFDQAASLRGARTGQVINLPTARRQRVIAVSGGKGGVGKSTMAVNLACVSAASGAKTLAFDGDLGMADLNLLLDVAPEHTLLDVLNGMAAEDVLVDAHGVKLLPGLAASYELANLEAPFRQRLIAEVHAITQRFETTIIDTAAGLHRDTMLLAAAADDVIVVATKDRTSLADAYACLKVLRKEHGLSRVYLLPNNVADESEAEMIMSAMNSMVTRFLKGFELIALPFVPHDPLMERAAKEAIPVTAARPDGATSRALKRVLRALDMQAAEDKARAAEELR